MKINCIKTLIKLKQFKGSELETKFQHLKLKQIETQTILNKIDQEFQFEKKNHNNIVIFQEYFTCNRTARKTVNKKLVVLNEKISFLEREIFENFLNIKQFEKLLSLHQKQTIEAKKISQLKRYREIISFLNNQNL